MPAPRPSFGAASRRFVLRPLFVALVGLTTFSVVSGLWSAPAEANDVAKLDNALKKATRDYDELRIPQAEQRLEKAIASAERKGVVDPIVGRLYVMLGIVRFAVTREEDDAYQQFLAALQVDPNATIHPDYLTPDLESIMDRARADAPPPVESGDTGEPEVIGRAAITHRSIDSAKAGETIQFAAEVSENVPLYRVMLNYRHYGDTEYKPLEMAPDTGTRFLAVLGADEVRSSQIDYFIEVLDRTGGILANEGTPSAPLNIIVIGGGDDLPDDPEEPGSSGDQVVYIHAGAGGGFGLATASPEVNSDLDIDPGLAPSVVHIKSELGGILSESLNIGVFYRFQIEPGSRDQDHMVGAKLRWWFASQSAWKIYSSVGGGWGTVRHTVNLAPVVDFVDTTREGPFHGGVGFGIGYAINENFMVLSDFYTMFLFPEISGHIDATLGVRTSF